MDILLVVALAVGAAVCFLPGIMAWSYYFGGSRKAQTRRASLGRVRPAASHIH